MPKTQSTMTALSPLDDQRSRFHPEGASDDPIPPEVRVPNVTFDWGGVRSANEALESVHPVLGTGHGQTARDERSLQGRSKPSRVRRDPRYLVGEVPEGVRTLVDRDGSVLYNFGLYDTVRFPAKELTGPSVCVSVQKGCSLEPSDQGCKFCSTGRYVRFKDNLTSDEIAEEARIALSTAPDLEGSDRARIVFAGMGESSYNLKNVAGAMEIIQAEHPDHAIDFVIASIGTPPKNLRLLGDRIVKSFEEGRLKKGTQIYLQLSTHASTDEKRAYLIPISGRHPLESVLVEAQAFCDKIRPWVEPVLEDPEYPDRLMVTLNYLMLGPLEGEFEGNTTDEDIDALADLVTKLGADDFIVRLSAYNADRRDGEHTFQTVPPERFIEWRDQLTDRGVFVRMFQSEATEVRGGCGQLTGMENPEHER